MVLENLRPLLTPGQYDEIVRFHKGLLIDINESVFDEQLVSEMTRVDELLFFLSTPFTRLTHALIFFFTSFADHLVDESEIGRATVAIHSHNPCFTFSSQIELIKALEMYRNGLTKIRLFFGKYKQSSFENFNEYLVQRIGKHVKAVRNDIKTILERNDIKATRATVMKSYCQRRARFIRAKYIRLVPDLNRLTNAGITFAKPEISLLVFDETQTETAEITIAYTQAYIKKLRIFELRQ